MKNSLFTGACTALVTPFLNGNVNYPMLEQLIRRQIRAGIEAIVVCGTTGESAALTDEEKLRIIAYSKACARKECLIIAGTGSNSTAKAIDLSKHAEEAGADALLVINPYYNKSTPEGLILHFQAIADAVSIPVILYNVPSRTGQDIPISVYKALAAHPNIIGVKEANPDLSRLLTARAECPADFHFWSGNDDLTVPISAIGGVGVISVLANVFPEITQAMAKAALQGEYTTAAALQLRMEPLTHALFSQVNPIPVKEAMKIIGYDCGDCRMPLTRASTAVRDKLSVLIGKI